MQENKIIDYIHDVVQNIPKDWLNLTTHRLDIYDEARAKGEFLEQFESLFQANNSDRASLNDLPTAFDYIRLGHPLSCVLEWTIAKINNIDANRVISFSSATIPLLAVLRKNKLEGIDTQILYAESLPEFFDETILRSVYGYDFSLKKVGQIDGIDDYQGSTIWLSKEKSLAQFKTDSKVDFFVNTHSESGSVLIVNGYKNEAYISEIQHVRRRETIAMTPANSYSALRYLVGADSFDSSINSVQDNKLQVLNSIKKITETTAEPLVASSGLSIQYAIVMGLIHEAQEKLDGKPIKIIVPPNCYGGTNDQARRVAAVISGVDIVDLPVDSGNDMVKSIDQVLDQIAEEDAVPYIIAEIPTNPRVEVPELIELKSVLSKVRTTGSGQQAVDPVFILDQTFCPNIHFLGEGEILSYTRAISYASGSKFPSGGKCTAGYCVANKKAEGLMKKISLHLSLCDNEATSLQYEILAKQLPSMNQRIKNAYINTRSFVSFIEETLPQSKINFVSEELAKEGFTPSVFSLDLPTKGNSDEEREAYKRTLNLKLIQLMIDKIPNESKYCVSYGQLKGCYWTIPATSTQGTTKEGDKDYIARVALSPEMDLEQHKKVFLDFVKGI
jgi:cystathionine beta-lyase/cystathionine gamma-synthase